ncbi:MAG TPA: N,N-dimethylformamidase beta subunit family domain-containing protein [Candidatus Nanopelagicales bacterium]|nr:N,N-dimethylformamidase beta subunit family domain-containing protein [Candidatus Nanopelagicales bacterium]
MSALVIVEVHVGHVRAGAAALVVGLATVSTLLSSCGAAGPAPISPTASGRGGTPVERPMVAAGAWSYDSSYDVPVPQDSAALPTGACSVPSGWVGRESRLPGTSAWRGIDWGESPRVAVYADRPSTRCGVPVSVHLGGAGARHVVVRAFRVGWYAGSGARLVWSSRDLAVPPASPARAGSGAVGPTHWTTSVALPVDAAWPPGLYLVAADVRGRLSGATALVVRSSAPPSLSAVMYSNLTWSAYSVAGGASLYQGVSRTPATRALTVAVARPMQYRGDSPVATYDVPVAQILDRAGVEADPLVDTDVDIWPSLLVHRTEIVLPGHSEYWTTTMYSALVAARNAGANIADLGANDVYWHARVGYAGDAPATLFVARQLARDPLAAQDPSMATVEWRARPLLRNPSAVLGQSYTAVRAEGGTVVRPVPSWLSGIPGFTAGAVLPHAAWNEVNGVRPRSYPVPDDLQVLAQGVLVRHGFADQPVSTTYYSSRSGGGVFAAGSTYWPCLVVGSCPDVTTSPAERATLWEVVRRVVVGFRSPGFGALHPSQPSHLPSVAVLRSQLPAGAVGIYGVGD